MATQQEKEKRISQVVDLWIRGIGTKQIAETVQVSPRTVRNDIKEGCDAKKVSENLIGRSLMELNKLQHEAWDKIDNADNDSAKLGAIRTLNDIVSKKMEIAQNSGLVAKAPEKHEVSSDKYTPEDFEKAFKEFEKEKPKQNEK